MKKLLFLFTALLCLNTLQTKAQYVTIPDAKFAAWLQIIIPSAMNGNQMDTTNPAVISLNVIYIGDSISDLTGIKYFKSLTLLECSYSQLTNLSTLPASLSILHCQGNQLISLPALPNNLISLNCYANQLTSLPTLPSTLDSLVCGSNLITNLPVLPNSITYLACNDNHLSNLATLSNTLQFLYCNNNQLTGLPALPNNTLQVLDCSFNNIACFPTFPSSLFYTGNCVINNNPFSCLPNYVSAMDATTLAYPLCAPGNSNGCPGVVAIFGFTYKDMNADCIKNSGDNILYNIPLKLYDNNNNLVGKTYSGLNNMYNFPLAAAGIYNIVVDTTAWAFATQCVYPGFDSLVNVSSIDTINFALSCKPGFDVGVQSIVSNGIVFPGQQHHLSVIAGDLSQWYNLNCPVGVGGQVQITINGPVTYVAPAIGALTPNITGNVYTYTVTDFGTVICDLAFDLILATDTTAQIGDTICVNISITPTTTDNNPLNNNLLFCYAVGNSHDPNYKETYPTDVLPAYQNWFTYTIHFQNTGTSQASNISLTDTLDNNLDLSTFQLINYSHKNTVLLNGNSLDFNFQNINLPDSTSDLAGSSGFVQYRIKPKANLPAGTQIKNTAYIYFDYNAAVVTNTSINNFNSLTGISTHNTQNSTLHIYPNPANNKITIDAPDVVEAKLFDVLGKQILIAKEKTIDVNNFNDGIYFIQVQTNQNTATQKIIIQH